MSDTDIIRRIEAAVIARHGVVHVLVVTSYDRRGDVWRATAHGHGNSISVTVRPSDGHRRKRDALARLAVVCGACESGGERE